jgi:hypothetical protein
MTTKSPPRAWRRIAVTAIAAGAIAAGAGVATGNGVASADESTAPNNSVSRETANPTARVAPNGSMQILTTVVKEMHSMRNIGTKNIGS